MKHIEIISGNDVLSNIYSGDSVKDIASLLRFQKNLFVVLDRNLSYLIPQIETYTPVHSIFTLEATEENKNIQTVMDICGWLLEQDANRDAYLLGVGGGITTDLTGMAACIYKRGIRFAFFPTTLLAQTDAAIGGKNGVNYKGYKNIAGIIRQPEFTFECAEVLSTLPYEDFVSGTGELLKSFIIDNEGNCYEKAIRLLSRIHSEKEAGKETSELIQRHSDELCELIMAAAKVKADIVGRDMDEKDERRKLNLGHTFAHAIEWKSDNEIPHGKAVAIGTVMAARLSEKMGLAPSGLSERLENDFQSCGLPTTCGYRIQELEEAMKKDKKALDGQIHFILPRGIGEVLIQPLSTAQLEIIDNTI